MAIYDNTTPGNIIGRPPATNTVGTVPSTLTGTSVQEYGAGAVRQTVFTFTNQRFTLADLGTTGAGGTKIMDLPEGNILFLGGVLRATIVDAEGTTGNITLAVGTVTAAADATLTSTEANIVPVTSATAEGAVASAVNTAVAFADGTTTPVDIFLNALSSGDPTAVATANGFTITGTLTVTWLNLGDR